MEEENYFIKNIKFHNILPCGAQLKLTSIESFRFLSLQHSRLRQRTNFSELRDVELVAGVGFQIIRKMPSSSLGFLNLSLGKSVERKDIILSNYPINHPSDTRS
jgi:hypothetical protein